MEDCYKIDMGCECYPLPPDKPLPFVFPAFNTFAIDNSLLVFRTHPSNPGQVGIGVSGLPSYTNKTIPNCNFAVALPITIDPPPGFPGPGLVQATATMTVSGTDITVTMTNNGAGYPSTSSTVINHTFGNYHNTIRVYPSATYGGSFVGMCQPVAQLAGPLPYYPNLTLASAKVIPQICGTIEFTAAPTLPLSLTGKWYKNGVQIGSDMYKAVTIEGKKPWVHYCPPTTFNSTDILDYTITSNNPDMVNFTGDVLYYIQYI